jgi:hypothetical protein
VATVVARPRERRASPDFSRRVRRRRARQAIRAANVPGNLGRAIGNGILLTLFMVLLWYFA